MPSNTNDPWLAALVPADDPLLHAARACVASYEERTRRQPQTRKANGVFFTPVRLARTLALIALGHTLGQAVERGDPDAIEGLRIIDPAAGAGSLLLAALELLAQAHKAASERAPGAKHAKLPLADRRRLLSACLHAVDLDPESVKASADTLSAACGGGSNGLHHVCADALLDDLPKAWSTPFDALLANPPFGSVNRLGRHHPRQKALAEHYPLVWQDKADISAFFVRRGALLATQCAFIIPATLLAADKARRLRAHLADTYDVRFLALREAFLFPDAAVTVALMNVAHRATPDVSIAKRAPVRGWAFDSDDLAATWPVQDAFARGQRAPAGVVVDDDIAGSRWNPARSSASTRWTEMDARSVWLGSRYLVGKGMETGRNGAFVLSNEVLAKLDDESRARFVRRRVRGVDVESLSLKPANRWLLYPEDAESLDALPPLLRDHLLAHRAALESRAAYRRGGCVWWRYTWPLHRQHYGLHRVITPYRSATHRFAPVVPDGGIGLTDTTAIFVETAAEAQALAALLESAPIVDRYRGLTKRTGVNMMEFFENQLREVPLPTRWEQLIEPLADLARRAREGERDARREIDERAAAAYGQRHGPQQHTLPF